MTLTRTDELALAAARKCIENCKQYHVIPEPYFPLLLRMNEELERLGQISYEGEEPDDVCTGCPADRNGNCENGYQMAELSLDGRKVHRCRYRAIAEARAKKGGGAR